MLDSNEFQWLMAGIGKYMAENHPEQPFAIVAGITDPDGNAYTGMGVMTPEGTPEWDGHKATVALANLIKGEAVAEAMRAVSDNN